MLRGEWDRYGVVIHKSDQVAADTAANLVERNGVLRVLWLF